MEMSRRMCICLPSLIALVVTILPVLNTAEKLDNKGIMTVNVVTEYTGAQFWTGNGEPSYRLIKKIDDSIYIGGNESLIRVYLVNGDLTTNLTTLNTTQQKVTLSCSVLNADNNETVCWNFIRVVEKLNEPPNQLLVCGTNANERLCYRCDTTDLLDINCTAGSVSRLNVVPRLPDVRPSTALFDTLGTNSEDGILFAALSGVNEPTLQKYSVPFEGDPEFELDTVTTRGKFIQKGVVFVGDPFEYTDPDSGHAYVFTFYRELAKEYENHGEKVYSRLSRVCKNDTGDSSRSNKLATFIKARVNCSVPDLLLPYHYDLIQDVIWKNDTKEVYAVFTSQELGPAASALCRYRMSDIMKLFDDGKFKDQAGDDPNRLWLPFDTDPTPRPGTCGNVHTTSYPPLLDKLVPNYNPINPSPSAGTALLITSALPTLYIDGIRFTALTADFLEEKCVFFFGTTTGIVLKAYKDNCSSSAETFKTVKLDFTSVEPINGLGLLGGATDKVLVVTGANDLMDWPIVGGCSYAKEPSECEHVFGPYCTWTGGSCRILGSPEGPSGPPVLVLVQPHISSIEACGMDKVVLYCEADWGKFNTESFSVNWTKTDEADFITNNNHLVSVTSLSPSLLEMEVTVIKGASDGLYNCSSTLGASGASLVTKQVEIIHTDCLTENNLIMRCDLHEQLEMESRKIKEAYSKDKTCSIDVQTCDTCPTN